LFGSKSSAGKQIKRLFPSITAKPDLTQLYLEKLLNGETMTLTDDMTIGKIIINHNTISSRGLMKKKKVDYQVYVLRVWKEEKSQPDSRANVRLSLENTKTGTRIGFTDWSKFARYLKEQTNELSANSEE
jgi:hypothetical protein